MRETQGDAADGGVLRIAWGEDVEVGEVVVGVLRAAIFAAGCALVAAVEVFRA